jgi:DNA adenine methylase
MMTVNGTSGSVHSGFSFSDSFVRGGREARVNRWYQFPERLERIVERLRSVRVENKDAIRVVEQFANRPGTLMYLDPPYLMDRRHTYSTDANDAKYHEKLLETCVASTAMLIISGYRNSLYSKYLNPKSGWTARSIAATTRGTTGRTTNRTEVLWINDAFKKANKNGKVPVRLTQIELAEKKVNPERRPKRV